MLTKGMMKETQEVGLCVNSSLPHQGASPDCMMYDPKPNSKFGGFEILPDKNPGIWST